MERPLYFIGFSLGGLLGFHYIVRHPYQQFKKCVLIAPATHTRPYTIIPALIANIFPKGSLPSLNLKNYRARPMTSLLEYKKMRYLQKEIQSSLKINTFNLSTLLITNAYDELISSLNLTKFAAQNPHWSSLKVTNKGSHLPKKFHHLMIDSDSLGEKEWEKMLKSITNHLAL